MIFPNSESNKKPIHVPIVQKKQKKKQQKNKKQNKNNSKKNNCLERTQYAFLDHSKTLGFSDVIKIDYF